ncbi:transposase [Mycobacterium sp. C31M]
MPKRYPEEFRRKVLDLVAAGHPIAQIAADLNISDQTIYGWRKQELEGDPFGGPVAMRLSVGGSWPSVGQTRQG